MHPLLLSLVLLAPVASAKKAPHAASGPATAPARTCESKLQGLLAAMKQPGNDPRVRAETALIVADTSYAEYLYDPPPCTDPDRQCFDSGDPHKKGSAQPFVVSGSIANATSVGGVSYVAAPPEGTPRQVTFVIFEESGKARLQWLYRGKRHNAPVSSCAGRHWTAATTASAISILLGPVEPKAAA